MKSPEIGTILCRSLRIPKRIVGLVELRHLRYFLAVESSCQSKCFWRDISTSLIDAIKGE